MSFHVVFSFWTVMTRFVISGSGQVFSGLAESTAFPIVRSGSWSRSSAGFAIYQVRPLTQFDINNYVAKCLVWSLVPWNKSHLCIAELFKLQAYPFLVSSGITGKCCFTLSYETVGCEKENYCIWHCDSDWLDLRAESQRRALDTHFRQSGVSFEALASSYLREIPPQVQVPKHRNGEHAAGVVIQTL